MSKYPYIQTPNSLRKFLTEMKKWGAIDKLTQTKLESLGYKSKNERAIISVMKFIGFLSEDGTPTESFRAFKVESKSKAVMAAALRKSYSELFALYPDANVQSPEKLRDFFKGSTDAGEKVVSYTVNTFRTLCESADFEAEATAYTTGETGRSEERTIPVGRNEVTSGKGVTINVNIQLQLPTTENAEVYDKIFQSLKKHVLQEE